jgi:serine/threonine-protein kinase
MIIGTPNYMSPEQAAGSLVTPRSDIYALGAIAYRCLTGRAPFASRDVAAMLYQVVHKSPPRPHLRPSVPKGVDDVLAIALAKDPNARFRSALELVEALALVDRGGSVTQPVPPNAWSDHAMGALPS